MRHIADWFKSEVVTINDHESGKKYVIRSWHVQALAFVVGWLLG